MHKRLVSLVTVVVACSAAAPAATAAAQAPPPSLAVRKDGLRPGWFLVGTAPGAGTDVAIDVQIQVDSDAAPARKFRSPDQRSFNLCEMLRAAGWAGRPSVLYLTITRGKAAFKGRISYDGKLCVTAPPSAQAASPPSTAPPPQPPKPVASLTLPPPLVLGPEGLTVAEPPPAEAPRPEATQVAMVQPAPPEREAAATVPPASAQPASPQAALPQPTPSQATPPRAPAPTAVATVRTAPPSGPPAESVVAERAAPTPQAQAPPAASAQTTFKLEEASEGAGASTPEARGLTSSNFKKLNVWLFKDPKEKTEEYRFELEFFSPVNIEGIEEAMILSAQASMTGITKTLFEEGTLNVLDPVDNPQATPFVVFTVPKGFAIAQPGVFHGVYLTVRIGGAEFTADATVRRRKS